MVALGQVLLAREAGLGVLPGEVPVIGIHSDRRDGAPKLLKPRPDGIPHLGLKSLVQEGIPEGDRRALWHELLHSGVPSLQVAQKGAKPDLLEPLVGPGVVSQLRAGSLPHLEELGLPGAPVRQLTRLFESVRYGTAITDEEASTTAIAALTAIVNALDSVATLSAGSHELAMR